MADRAADPPSNQRAHRTWMDATATEESRGIVRRTMTSRHGHMHGHGRIPHAPELALHPRPPGDLHRWRGAECADERLRYSPFPPWRTAKSCAAHTYVESLNQKKQRKTSLDNKGVERTESLVNLVKKYERCNSSHAKLRQRGAHVQHAGRPKPASRRGGLVYLRPTASLARVLAL